MLKYFKNLIILFDEAINVIFLAGNAHETISERAAVANHNNKLWGCVLCKFLNLIKKGHCDRTYLEITTPQIEDEKLFNE